MIQKEDRVSLRRDLPQVPWGGILLQPDVDLLFWLERLPGTSRIIRAALVRPGHVLELITQHDFDMECLGRDYTRIETPVFEMVVISQHFKSIMAQAHKAEVMITIKIIDELMSFQGATGIMGRWDWFIDPSEYRGGMPILTSPRPLSELGVAT